MKFQTEVKQVLGTPGQKAWSQVHHFLPDKKDKFLKRGELILLVSLGEISDSQPTAAVGREIISRFHEEYYGNLEKKPMAALEEAAKKVAQEKSQYFDRPQEISFVCLVIWKNIAYLLVYHQGKILLRREKETVQILDGLDKNPASASGFIKTDDIYVLGTTDFFSKLPSAIIDSGLSEGDLEKIIEIWAPVVHAREDQGRLGAVIIKIGNQQKNPQFVESEPKETIVNKKKKKIIKVPQLNFGFIRSFLNKISSLSIAVGFLILLGVSIIFGWRKRQEQQKQTRTVELSSVIEEKISNATSIRNLDPEESLNLLKEAEVMGDELKEFDKAKAEAYISRVEEIKKNLGDKALQPEMYYDMRLVDENIEIGSVFCDGKKALVQDLKGKRLVVIDLDNKSAEIIAAGDNLSGEGQLTFTEGRQYFVFDKEVYWVDDDKLSKLLDLEAESVITAAGGWLGNLYLLDSGREQIWKFPVISGGIGSGRPWLNSKSDLDFSGLTDMSIDGNIWLLAEDGKIFNYLSGEKQDLAMQLPAGIGKAEFLSVAREAERLSFWDADNKIIWLFSKEGDFILRQPVEFENLRNMSIASDGSKVYLFAKDKIYLVEL